MMGPCIGRFSLAVCMAAAGAASIGMIHLERRTADVGALSTGPVVDAEEVAAVIAWAREGAGVWEGGADAASDRASASEAVVRVSTPDWPAGGGGGAIVVPSNARAGGGKVSSIPGGEWGGHGGRRYPAMWGMRSHTRALDRTAPGLPPRTGLRSR